MYTQSKVINNSNDAYLFDIKIIPNGVTQFL